MEHNLLAKSSRCVHSFFTNDTLNEKNYVNIYILLLYSKEVSNIFFYVHFMEKQNKNLVIANTPARGRHLLVHKRTVVHL